MTEYVHLVGAEDVRSAANTMRSAAEGMNRAATNIEYALEKHQRFLDDWLVRLETVLEKPTRHLPNHLLAKSEVKILEP